MTTAYPAALDSYAAKVDNVTDVLAADVNDLQDAVVAIETELGTQPQQTGTWTPTVSQSGAVAATVTRAVYHIVNSTTATTQVILAVTAAGIAANAIIIAGQPAAIQPATTDELIGSFLILDSGVGYYAGAVHTSGATDWRFFGHLETNAVGIDPNFALANGDKIYLNCTYRIA